jgi:hypothetical protein
MVEAMAALVLMDHALRQEAVLAARQGLVQHGALLEDAWRLPPFVP